MRAIFEALGVAGRGGQVGRHLQPAQHDQGDVRRARPTQLAAQSVAARRGKKVSRHPRQRAQAPRRAASSAAGAIARWPSKAKIKVTQIGSPIGRTNDQRAHADRPRPQQAAPQPRARGYARGPRHDPQGPPPGAGRAARLTAASNRAGRSCLKGARKLASDKDEDHETQRAPRQSGRPQAPHARRPRHRLGQGQDRRPRRQGPDGAHRRRASTASKAARCRSTGACRSAASTTSSGKDYAEVNLGAVQKAIDAGKLDAGEARSRRGAAGGRPGLAAARTASACSPRASSRPSSTFEVDRRLEARRSPRSRRPAAVNVLEPSRCTRRRQRRRARRQPRQPKAVEASRPEGRRRARARRPDRRRGMR